MNSNSKRILLPLITGCDYLIILIPMYCYNGAKILPIFKTSFLQLKSIFSFTPVTWKFNKIFVRQNVRKNWARSKCRNESAQTWKTKLWCRHMMSTYNVRIFGCYVRTGLECNKIIWISVFTLYAICSFNNQGSV